MFTAKINQTFYNDQISILILLLDLNKLYAIYGHTVHNMYHTATIHILNFVGKIFVFGWQEYSWGTNFHGHGNVVGTIVVKYARY